MKFIKWRGDSVKAEYTHDEIERIRKALAECVKEMKIHRVIAKLDGKQWYER